MWFASEDGCFRSSFGTLGWGESKSELDSHFGAISRYIKESKIDWDEDAIVDQVADAIKSGARSVDVIAVVAQSIEPVSESVKIVFPGIGCVHSFVQKGSVFLIEGRRYTRKTVVPPANAKCVKKKQLKPDSRKRVLAVRKKFRNLDLVRARGRPA